MAALFVGSGCALAKKNVREDRLQRIDRRGLGWFADSLKKEKPPEHERLAQSLALQWIRRLAAPGSSAISSAMLRTVRTDLASPVLWDGRVYAGSRSGRMVCLDVETGALIWSFEAAESIESRPVLADGKIFFTSNDRHVYALDAETGALAWKYKGRDEFDTDVVVEGGRLYAVSVDSTVYCLKQDSGEAIWRFPANPGKGKELTLEKLTIRGTTSPALGEGKVVFGKWDGSLTCLDAATGELAWRRYLYGGDKKFRDVDLTPVIESGLVYAATYDDRLLALRLDDGRGAWEEERRIQGAQILVEGERIYLPLADGRLQCFDAGKKEILWTYDSGSAEPLGTPAFFGDFLVVPARRRGLVFIDPADGAAVHRYFPGSMVSGRLFSEKDRLLFLTDQSYLYSFSAPRPRSFFTNLR